MTQLVKAGPFELVCGDPYEAARAQSFLTKEPGTIEWLDEILPGECVYDVGANVGLYTLLAARKVGATGWVCAFEPHVANAMSLMRNLAHNGLAARVHVLTFALGAYERLYPFHYTSKRAGSSGSQLGQAIGENGQPFLPALTELKYVTTLDVLAAGDLPSPDRIKIDVDGQEDAILAGGEQLLRRGTVRSLQVEAHEHSRELIRQRLARVGYAMQRVHFTANGRASIEDGADPMTVPHNEVFARA